MRSIVTNNIEQCVGCNRCIRVCPIEEANVVKVMDGKFIIEVDNKKCIACGACISACNHKVRGFLDDTDRFFHDLKVGKNISIFAAPAFKSNNRDWRKMISLLRMVGVRKIYDVSLGADICTWAHIRYIQKNRVNPLITQPCPAIVNYILLYKNELIKNLSPIHSPMLCTAIYMKKYQSLNDHIAAISPCIAKMHEFESTHLVGYNVTLEKLVEYIENNKIQCPSEQGNFDNMDAGLGSLYSMPGGLKENMEYYLGKSLNIVKAEGAHVYEALDQYGLQPRETLPDIFDVLNCQEGCNIGTGCASKHNMFEMSKAMDNCRKELLDIDYRDYLTELYEHFDKTLDLNDFIRKYTPTPITTKHISQNDIEKAFESLNKKDEISRKFDCGACGSDTCLGMAKKIAKGVNIPNNCIDKSHKDVLNKQASISMVQKTNLTNIQKILEDTETIKSLSENVVSNVGTLTTSIEQYNKMVSDINTIATKINIISLNASIEAARAGTHGRAFSVIAEEVRGLANSSKASLMFAEDSSALANTSIESLNSIIRNINECVSESYNNVTQILQDSKTIIKHAE